MIYHVLPGDAQVEAFRETGLKGEVIICREALITGDVDADTLDGFWNQRARYILAEYGEDEIIYHEKVADELLRLTDVSGDDEVNLWFEYEAFCSVNLWFCMSLLPDSVNAYRVHPSKLSEVDRWTGFGGMSANDLVECFRDRIRLSLDDLQLGRDLWNAYRLGDLERLRALGATLSAAFPYLSEIVDAIALRDTRPVEVLSGIRADGITEFADVFAEFKRRAGEYGYGDLQVGRLLDQIGS
jgi:hypothetical protein